MIFNIKLIMCSFSYDFITLLSKKYTTILYASLSNKWRNCISAYYHRVAMYLILHYEYDCNTICYKHVIATSSLVYTLGYYDAIILITLYHKATVFMFLHYQCMRCTPINVNELFFTLPFNF